MEYNSKLFWTTIIVAFLSVSLVIWGWIEHEMRLIILHVVFAVTLFTLAFAYVYTHAKRDNSEKDTQSLSKFIPNKVALIIWRVVFGLPAVFGIVTFIRCFIIGISTVKLASIMCYILFSIPFLLFSSEWFYEIWNDMQKYRSMKGLAKKIGKISS